MKVIFPSKSILSRAGASIALAVIAGSLVWFLWSMDSTFSNDYSTLVFDTKGRLLRATLAADQQFRFPPDTIPLPRKYVTALLTSEDKRFYSHRGVDLLALARAALTNLKAGKRISGGSTIAMQIARLSNPKPRTYPNKLRECLTALKISAHFSKEEILKLYASHAPMGGNIVGIQAASYLYFGKPPSELTWAEACLFAILPNSPSMINLERERPLLKHKRNELLHALFQNDIIDSVTMDLGCQEPLPAQGQHLPFSAPHFTRLVMDHRYGERIMTTLDEGIQRIVVDAAADHHAILLNQSVSNLAVIVAETKTGKVRAYVGSHDYYDQDNGGQVDGVQAFRSTGSLFKPFLVAKCLDKGPYTIASKIQDVPTFYGTFAPENASKQFRGLVSMRQVLIQSLNVPAVRLLNAYGLWEFYDFLVASGLRGLFRSPGEYGLTLILGGAEASLFELTQLYLALGNFGRFRPLRVVEREEACGKSQAECERHSVKDERSSASYKGNSTKRLFSEGASWLVLKVLIDLSRPGIEHCWNEFNDQIPVAWKTGTSYGQKDGWAIGVNRQWTIGVWAGNFTGEGNAALSGAKSAAPLLFTLFNALTSRNEPMWFDEPVFYLKEIACCKESGYPAGPHCGETTLEKIPRLAHMPGTCPFHRRFLVDKRTGRSVCSLCWNGIETEWVTLFVLPPSVREIFLKSGRHADEIPAHSGYCPNFHDDNRIELVYPVDGIKIFVPRDFDGEHEKIVLSAVHQQPAAHLFWYLNGSLIGETTGTHEMPIELNPGAYKLTVQDEEGFSRTATFTAYKRGI